MLKRKKALAVLAEGQEEETSAPKRSKGLRKDKRPVEAVHPVVQTRSPSTPRDTIAAPPLRVAPPSSGQSHFRAFCPSWNLNIKSSIMGDTATSVEAAKHFTHDLPNDRASLENLNFDLLSTYLLSHGSRTLGYAAETVRRARNFERIADEERLSAASLGSELEKSQAEVQQLQETKAKMEEESASKEGRLRAEIDRLNREIAKAKEELPNIQAEAVAEFKGSDQYKFDLEFAGLELYEEGFFFALSRVKLRYPDLDFRGIKVGCSEAVARMIPGDDYVSEASGDRETLATVDAGGDNEGVVHQPLPVPVCTEVPPSLGPAAPVSSPLIDIESLEDVAPLATRKRPQPPAQPEEPTGGPSKKPSHGRGKEV